MKLLLSSLFLLLCGAGYARQQDSVTIRGRVTDYNGLPIDSCSVAWQGPSFDFLKEAITDKDGYYAVRIAKGKYQSVAAINMSTYPRFAKPGLTEADQRLEFWAWNFIADRDTTLNIQYHRMEAHSLHAFYIAGGIPTYQIFVRPMSLTRFLNWQTGKAKNTSLAPPADKLKVVVWIDGEEVPVLMKQPVKENLTEYGNAYLLTVDMPKHPKKGLPYRVFKVELTDLENGDRGEGLYYMEKENYVK